MKMSAEKVQEMRRMYGEGATQGALARHFQIGIAQVGRIVRGECWQAGAGARAPTAAEADATLQRLLRTAELVKEREAFEEKHGPVGEMLGLVPTKKPPPSLLDGGDAPDETGGAGLSAAQKRALEFGVDMDRVLEMKE